MSKMQGLVLAGGEGTRLAAEGTPKALLSIGGRALVERAVGELAALGCSPIVCMVRAPVASRVRELVATRVVACETPTSLHTLAAGLGELDRGRAVLCTMVDTIMPPSEWQRMHAASVEALESGAFATLAVTPFVHDEAALYVRCTQEGIVSEISDSPLDPPCVTGGVYAFAPGAADAVEAALATDVMRVRGFLRWALAQGHSIATVRIEKIVDVDRREDVAAAEEWVAHWTEAP